LSSPNALQRKYFNYASENQTIQTLDLYGSVMFYYYQEYVNALDINDSAFNFEDFESNYHSSGLKIGDFVSNLVVCTSHSYKTVTISENFFADAITASYSKNVDDRLERFITLATKLNADKTLVKSKVCQIKGDA